MPAKAIQAMTKMGTIFSEILKLAPRSHFDKAVERHKSGPITPSRSPHADSLSRAQITGKDSLREIESVHRSTLAPSTGQRKEASGKGVIKDAKASLAGFYQEEDYPDGLRRIEFWDERERGDEPDMGGGALLPVAGAHQVSVKIRWGRAGVEPCDPRSADEQDVAYRYFDGKARTAEKIGNRACTGYAILTGQ